MNATRALLVALALTGCRHRDATAHAPLTAVAVDSVRVDLQQTPEIHEVAGSVRPKVAATVSAKIVATISTVMVKAGDTVVLGQPLAQLDDRELLAEFDRAKAERDRIKSLLDQQAAARAEFETVDARYRVAEAALSHAAITAPFDGIVASKQCDVGDLAGPTKPLFVIEQTGGYRFEARVPERYATAGAAGKRVHVVIDAIAEKCSGVIGESEPAADPVSRSYLVKIDLDCRQPVKSGMFGRAQLLVGERLALFVNKAAVKQRGQLTYVFVADQARARMRLVRTGTDYLDAVEVLSGLEPGETVIVIADAPLVDGQPIKRRPQPSAP